MHLAEESTWAQITESPGYIYMRSANAIDIPEIQRKPYFSLEKPVLFFKPT